MTYRGAGRTGAVLALCCVIGAGGCTVGPDYSAPPAVAVGEGWSEPAAAAAESRELDAWWRSLGDPELIRLIEQGVERNLDVRQAALRISEARAMLASAESRRLPAVDARGNANARRLSENGVLPVGERSGIQRDDTIYDAALDAVWEVDLFGRVSRSVESAEARAAAAEEEARAVGISVAAEIARTYFGLGGAQREQAARASSIAALERTFAVAQERVAAGDLPAAELDVIAARLAAARAALPAIDGRIRAAVLALGTLLGGLPEQELALERAVPPAVDLPALPAGERADLLRRRPDVRTAERQLAAATADVGIAVAEQFPRLVISASGGFQALAPGDLWESDSTVYSVAPLISWRIFDGGRIEAEIHGAEVRAERAALAYEQTVLAALGEAERSLSDYRHALDSISAQRAAVASMARARATADTRFASGDVTVLEVLDAERQLQDTLELEARAVTNGATSLVAAFKALGGGWPLG